MRAGKATRDYNDKDNVNHNDSDKDNGNNTTKTKTKTTTARISWETELDLSSMCARKATLSISLACNLIEQTTTK